MKNKTRRGTAALITVLFIAAMVGLNFLASAVQKAVPAFSADVTENSMFRLSDETKNFLKKLDEEIKITVLIDEEELIANGVYFNQANSIVRRFAAESGKISLKYDDYADNEAVLTSKYPDLSISNSSLFIVESDARCCVLDVTDVFETAVDSTTYSTYIKSSRVEQALITGVLTVTSEKLSKAAFITGLSDEDESGLYQLLKENAYSTTYVSLATDDIPQDCDIIILYAPAADLDETAVKKIEEFMALGGKTMLYFANYDKIDLTNTNGMLEKYKLALTDGVMYENDESLVAYDENPYMNLVNYGEGEILDNLKNKSIPFISPYTRPVEAISGEATVLLYGSSQSGVYPFDAPEDFDRYEAVTGNPVVAAAYGQKDGSTAVVFGSSSAFTSSMLSSTLYNNSAYFVTVCNAFCERDEEFDTVVESKTLSPTALTIKYASTKTALTVIFRWIIPLLTAAVGAAVFIKRRRS